MSELGEAAGGALALIGGGYLFLLLASALGAGGLFNFPLWGTMFISVGVLLIVAIVVAFVATVLGDLL